MEISSNKNISALYYIMLNGGYEYFSLNKKQDT